MITLSFYSFISGQMCKGEISMNGRVNENVQCSSASWITVFAGYFMTTELSQPLEADDPLSVQCVSERMGLVAHDGQQFSVVLSTKKTLLTAFHDRAGSTGLQIHSHWQMSRQTDTRKGSSRCGSQIFCQLDSWVSLSPPYFLSCWGIRYQWSRRSSQTKTETRIHPA